MTDAATVPTAPESAAETAKRVLLAAPRGYCAGVDRAVVTVEKALELYGPPVYVRKEIVHNKHVVTTLEKRGAIFVDETDQVPEGATVIFSAHGVAPVVHEEAKALSLKTIDATCPLVTKVHREATRFASQDYDILLIGHEGHEEVVGTAGEAPEHLRHLWAAWGLLAKARAARSPLELDLPERQVLLDAKGRIQTDVTVVRDGEDLLVVTEAAGAEAAEEAPPAPRPPSRRRS